MAWMTDTWTALRSYSGGRFYSNYLSVEGEAAARAAFGTNYPRLAAIKRRYDPDNILRRNANIAPGA
jgi:FAD/FMN-containing dehydrogenase